MTHAADLTSAAEGNVPLLSVLQTFLFRVFLTQPCVRLATLDWANIFRPIGPSSATSLSPSCRGDCYRRARGEKLSSLARPYRTYTLRDS